MKTHTVVLLAGTFVAFMQMPGEAQSQSRRTVSDDVKGAYWTTKSVCFRTRRGRCIEWAHRRVPVFPNMRYSRPARPVSAEK